MLTWNDIWVLIGINILLNLIFPPINEAILALFKKFASRLIGWLLKYASKQLPAKKVKIKENKNPSELLRDRSINLIQEGLPVVVDKFQKSGIDGIINLAFDRMSGFINANKPAVVVKDTVQVEDISDEASELQKYRLTKLAKE